MEGAKFVKPMIHLSCVLLEPMPNAVGKDRFAPLLPVCNYFSEGVLTVEQGMRSNLIPALNRGSDGAYSYCEPHSLRPIPSSGILLA